jgi:hypothetical protein
MLLRISHIFALLIVTGGLLGGCSGSPVGSNGNNVHIDIGDSIPRLHSNYSFQKSQLDMSNNVIPGNTFLGHFAIVNTTGLQIYGKNNVYFILDDADTCYYAYESNSDVSIYLQNPGYLQNHTPYDNTDETLQTILDTVFHNWITLPIATKDTGRVVYNATNTLIVSGDHISMKILAKADFIGDSSITLPSNEILAAKHCKLTITAIFDQVTYPGITVTHSRDIWFVPKIGYIAKLITRTNVPAIPILVVPSDTTAIAKTLSSYYLL